MIVALQEDLAKKNVRIQELDEMVASLNEDVEDLSTTTAAQSEKLGEQDKQLNTAYYCFGTAKELKDQKNPFRWRLVCQIKSIAERLQ